MAEQYWRKDNPHWSPPDEPPADDWQPPTAIPEGPEARAISADAPINLDLIDVSTLVDVDPPPREWLVPNRIPAGVPSLLSGDGAAGKTTIALQLAVATVEGGPGSWLNAVVDRRGPVLFFSAEEDRDELHRRVLAIARHHGRGLKDLAGLHILGLPGQDTLLGIVSDRSGVVKSTALFNALEDSARKIRPVLIVIEAAADTFGGNENDRGQVRQFIGLLRRLCNESGGAAVVLIAHPSLTGLTTGTGTSGSTGWSNSVRSRLYFAKARQRDDEEGDDDVRELRVMKSNYGPPGEVVRARWDRGVFVPEGATSSIAQAAAEADADHAYLDCLDAATVQGRQAFPHPGKGYAPKLFAGMPQAMRLSVRALAAAQERLFAAGRIHVVEFGPKSKRRARIERRHLLAEAAE